MIRYLEKDEKLNIKPLYEQCFEDTEEYSQYYFSELLPENYIAVKEEDGKIIGGLHLIPKTVTTGKLKTNVFYIYGVSTLKEYRRKHVMTDIFNFVIKDMYQDMEAFTYLIPSNEMNGEIYKRLGFEYVMDKKNIKPGELHKKPTHSLIKRKVEHTDFPRLSIFAESAMEEKYDVSITKNREYFKSMNKLMDVEKGKMNIYVENKVIVGYRIGFEDEIIEEVLDDSIQSMSWLQNDGRPYTMARILNIRKTLRLIGVKGVGQLVVKLNDPIIEENNGCFKWSYKYGNVKFEKTKEKPDFELTIGEFTAHVFGYKLVEGLPEVCCKKGFFINDYV